MNLGCSEDVLDRLRDFRSDAVTLNQSHREFSLFQTCSISLTELV